MPRKGKLVSWESRYPDYAKLEVLTTGTICCWRHKAMQCDNGCAAFRQDGKKIHCLALHGNSIIAELSDETVEDQLRDELRWALGQMRDLGVTEDQEERWNKARQIAN